MRSRTMRTRMPCLHAAVSALPACAQFDYGVGAGGVLTRFGVVESDDSHEAAWVRGMGPSGLWFSAFHHERNSDLVDLRLDLTLVHRVFSARYSHTAPEGEMATRSTRGGSIVNGAEGGPGGHTGGRVATGTGLGRPGDG